MKCLHCGYCCTMLDVIIIHPDFATDNFKLKDLSEENTLHKPYKEACPHLTADNGKFLCKVHDKPWYKKTPCFSHGQIESHPDNPCRMGEYLLANPDLHDRIIEIYEAKNNILKGATVND